MHDNRCNIKKYYMIVDLSQSIYWLNSNRKRYISLNSYKISENRVIKRGFWGQ